MNFSPKKDDQVFTKEKSDRVKELKEMYNYARHLVYSLKQ